MGFFDFLKWEKEEPQKCIICGGQGRIVVRIKAQYPLDYLLREERCQMCEGKGFIKND